MDVFISMNTAFNARCFGHHIGIFFVIYLRKVLKKNSSAHTIKYLPIFGVPCLDIFIEVCLDIVSVKNVLISSLIFCSLHENYLSHDNRSVSHYLPLF